MFQCYAVRTKSDSCYNIRYFFKKFTLSHESLEKSKCTKLMIMHLYLLKLSLLTDCFLMQIGAFEPLSFNGRQGVKPCKIFPGYSTILANGLALNCTTEIYHVVLADCPLLFFLMPLQSSCMRMRQWCLHSRVKDSDTCRYLD